MWVITTDGFYSVVAYDDHRYEPTPIPKALSAWPTSAFVVVRVRDRADLEKIAPFLALYSDGNRLVAEVEITEQFGDYAARAVVLRESWRRYLDAYVQDELTYTNFKNAIKDNKRHSLLSSVWSVMARWGTVGPWDRRRTKDNDSALTAEGEVRGYYQSRGGKRVWVKGYTRGRS